MMRMMALVVLCAGLPFAAQADDLMTIAAQLQGFGMEDPTITADTMKLMKAAQGDVSEL